MQHLQCLAFLASLFLGTIIPQTSASASSLDCETGCGVNRVQICHFNGQTFQTLCIRRNSALRRPNNHHSAAQDYCGPCTSHKAFDSTLELRQAVKQYVSKDHFDARLAETYGWPMNNWNVSLVEDFSELFAKKQSFGSTESLSGWDMSRATDLSLMFWHCTNFDSSSLSEWDVSNVHNLERTFFGATNFNGDLSRWQTSRVTNMMGVFWRASSFNQPLDTWDLSKTVDTSRMFAEAHSFDQDLSRWNTETVRDMSFMFMQATSFSQDLSKWQIPNVYTMEPMLHKVNAYEVSTTKQVALLDSWKTQVGQDNFAKINTLDIFSTPPSPLQEQRQEVATSFMRRGRKNLHHKNKRVHLASGQPTRVDGNAIEERNQTRDSPPRPQRYPFKCDEGFCQSR